MVRLPGFVASVFVCLLINLRPAHCQSQTASPSTGLLKLQWQVEGPSVRLLSIHVICLDLCHLWVSTFGPLEYGSRGSFRGTLKILN
jgi:hypothetical protein